MSMLADIQTKGDSMLAGIRWQKEMLETLEQNLEKTEKKMEEAEKKTQNLEEEKVGLESDVWELQGKKNQLMMEMETEKEEMVRWGEGLMMMALTKPFMTGCTLTWNHWRSNSQQENLSWIISNQRWFQRRMNFQTTITNSRM